MLRGVLVGRGVDTAEASGSVASGVVGVLVAIKTGVNVGVIGTIGVEVGVGLQLQHSNSPASTRMFMRFITTSCLLVIQMFYGVTAVNI